MRKDRVRRFAVVAVVAVAIAITVVTAFAREPHVSGDESSSAASPAIAVVASEVAVRSLAGSETDASRPVDHPSVEDAAAVVIEVRDAASRLVPGVRLAIANAAGRELRNELLDDGVMRLPAHAPPAVVLACRATVSLPGRIDTPPIRHARVGVFVVDAGAVGTLRVVCKRAAEGARLQVHEVRDGAARGTTGVASMSKGAADVLVAAGAVTYRVGSTDSGQRIESQPFAGPRSQGDVVEVSFDPSGCKVTGRLDAVPRGMQTIRATLIGSGAKIAADGEIADDGSFVLTLPRVPMESLTFFVYPDSIYVCPPLTLDGDERDVGLLTKLESGPIGILEVRDPGGELVNATPRVLWCTTTSGERIEAGSRPDAFVRWKHVRGVGMECRVGPVIVEVAVAVHGGVGLVPEPRTAVIRGGATFRVNLVPGGRVVVLLSEPGTTKLREVWLESIATDERVSPETSRFEDRDEGLQHHEFFAVPVGRYRIAAKAAEVAGGSLEVLAGSAQQLRVTLLRR